MKGDTIQIWSTGVVLILCFIAAAIVGPYAYRELMADRTKLRGQFALGLTTLFFGIAGRLAAAWLFYFSADRSLMLNQLHIWILGFNLLIAVGAVQCIRLVTLKHYGEWPWVAAAAGSAIVAALIV